MTPPRTCQDCTEQLWPGSLSNRCARCHEKLPALPLQAIVDRYAAGNTHRSTDEHLQLDPRTSSGVIANLRQAGLNIQRNEPPPRVPHAVLGPKGRSRPAFNVARRT